jgi:signal transduction histidine kinase
VGGAALDVTAQMLVEEALKRADRQKDEFVAMLAHELRNPLTAIHYANEVARQGSQDEGEIVATIEHQVQHLMHLIDDLLDVSRITQGKVQLKQEQVDAADVVRRAIDTVRPLVERHRHRLSAEVSDAPMPLFGDATRLEQVFVNLLTNATKYTPDGGKIDVMAAPQYGDVVVRVRDSGIGIPEHMLARVFELFSQGERMPDRSDGGLGIGLSVVRNLVEIHGGSVYASSNGPGLGSEFTVHLPIAKSATGLAASGPALAR